MSEDVPEAVLAAYDLANATVTRITSGWINRTFLVERGAERYVLQRLHPVFSGEVNRDIDAIARHLAARDVAAPRIVPTATGALWVEVDRPWRMLTFLAGESVSALGTPALARSAGAFVGRFHDALVGFPHTFAFTRPGVHDTAAHRAKLRDARSLEIPERARVDALAEALLAYPLPTVPALPTRIVHGDLKATNLLFEGETAVGIVDLDTLGHGTLALEMGDALRSWCNPTDESDTAATFDAATFEAALEGYAESSRGFLTPAEARSFVGGAETIAVELACRFCADAYEDRYFGFDAARYPTRRAHNMARTLAQLSLARSIRDQRDALGAIVERIFSD